MAKVVPVTRGRKFTQVLEGARTVFLRDGFEGASVDDIAREAAVSKATLYSYFSDKRLMFIEVFRAELQRDVADARALLEVDLPVAQVLPFIVQMISSYVVSEVGLRVYRVSIGEAERFPMLAREYYEAGQAQLRRQLVQYFERCVARGELKISDFELAADQLVDLSSASIRDCATLLGRDSVTPERMRRVNRGAVEMFLSHYGVADLARTPA
ncbi:TetR/AcrR family transcriptional regulator [Paracoccus sp. (in: a-proteobacteria)]|uniref:TetR/AcrR family transcriptional regulator n=1 Tax=Paracoccus sp. TaxID=267 RepID=UPI00289BEE9D|nr:TetR/AcrR family transcriptional regulator [Paracoccus sp. (in: a-proteobacteria)]